MSALSLYDISKVGLFGDFLKGLLLGFFGTPSLLVPPILVACSLLIILGKDKGDFYIKLKYFMILIVIIASFIQLIIMHTNKLHFGNKGFTDSMIISYNLSKESLLYSGGLIGALISYLLSVVFQYVGTLIILAAFALIDIVIITNVSVSDALPSYDKKFFQDVRWD